MFAPGVIVVRSPDEDGELSMAAIGSSHPHGQVAKKSHFSATVDWTPSHCDLVPLVHVELVYVELVYLELAYVEVGS